MCPYLWGIELINARLHRSVLIELHVYQSLGSYLRTLHEVSELVELLATVVGTSWHAYSTDILCLVEYAERACTFQYVHQLYKLHAEAQVGLVATETAHSLMPRHLL